MSQQITNGVTEGTSPKAIAALLGPALPGLVVLIVGLATGDADLRAVGLSLLGGGGIAGVAAKQAKTGTITRK